jgi:hypothetical protein
MGRRDLIALALVLGLAGAAHALPPSPPPKLQAPVGTLTQQIWMWNPTTGQWEKMQLDTTDLSCNYTTHVCSNGANTTECGALIDGTCIAATLDLSGKTVILPNATTNPSGACTEGRWQEDNDATVGRRFFVCENGVWRMLVLFPTGAPAKWDVLASDGAANPAPVWKAPTDPTTVVDLYDEFATGNVNGGALTNGTIGSLGWSRLIDGTSGCTAGGGTNGVAGRIGLNVTRANNSVACVLAGSGILSSTFLNGFNTLSTRTSWFAVWSLALGETTSVKHIHGFMDQGVAPPTSTNLIGIRYDTGSSDTNFMCIACTAGTCTATSTGVAANTSYHKFRIDMSVSGTLRCQVDAAAAVTVATNVPTADMSPAFSVTSLSAATHQFTIDYWWFRDTNITR